ncbi:hypothetical protein B0H14DRAFT_2638345 [Mycena olivaceomarginata]|nr:hypothetical protein B0H14DRAFT_2638345 [Mycena olivaceomarginata]
MSENSVYTTTSSSTQWGPGAMAGKAILAMGKAVVRGTQYLIITRRLSAIKAVMPCSDDFSNYENFEAMFDDLLELSRPSLYPDGLRTQAMQLIIAQIARTETYHLRLSILKWEIDHEELVAFLLEIIGVVLFSRRGFPDRKLVDAYNMSLPDDCHPWSPCIKFMLEIAQLTDSLFHAVLDARFLEMVLWVSGAQIHHQNYNEDLKTECHMAFQILSQPPSHDLSILWVEQVLRICTTEHPTSLLAMHQPSTRKRPTRLGPGGTHNFLETDYTAPSGLLHDSPPATFQTKYVLSASIRNFLRCIGIGGDLHRETVNHLSGVSYAKKVETLLHIIQHMIVQSLLDPSTVAPSLVLFRKETSILANDIVQFLLHVWTSLQSVDNPLLDAALLNLLPVLSIGWEPARIHEEVYRRVNFPIRRRARPAYRTRTLELLSTIRSEGLDAVVNERHRNGSWVYFLEPLFHI